MNGELKYIFENINNWLKFAEAKHTGLLVFNSGILVAILSLYSTVPDVIGKIPLVLTCIFLGISTLGSLFSQFPETADLLIKKKDEIKPNLYFFEHLAKIDVEDFQKEFKLSIKTKNFSLLDENLVVQILSNSKITSSKFKLFKFCCYFTSLGLIFQGIATLILVIWH